MREKFGLAEGVCRYDWEVGMTDALAKRIRAMIQERYGMNLPNVSADAAHEALAWFQEQMPSREEIATTASAVPWMPTGPYTDQPHWYAIADALLALLREKLTLTKEETL